MQTFKTADINGVRLQYVEQGAGEPMVFVHGLVSDLRAWEPAKEERAKNYRFIAYTQRYFGTGAWNDDGKFGASANLWLSARLSTAANRISKAARWPLFCLLWAGRRCGSTRRAPANAPFLRPT
jgi:pimeloyl-ACP methyl ester carboxylesterase